MKTKTFAIFFAVVAIAIYGIGIIKAWKPMPLIKFSTSSWGHMFALLSIAFALVNLVQNREK